MPISAGVIEELQAKLVPGSSYWAAVIETKLALQIHIMQKWHLSEGEAASRVTGRLKELEKIVNKVKRIEKVMGQQGIDSLEKLEELVQDIAGVRVAAQHLSQIDEVVDFIKQHDRWQTIPKSHENQVHNASATGYRGYHVTVWAQPTGLCPVRCEIQVRTLLQHAWATINRDLIYEAIAMGTLVEEIPKELLRLAFIQSDLLYSIDQIAEIYKEQFLKWYKGLDDRQLTG